jgi:hypothetical protein
MLGLDLEARAYIFKSQPSSFLWNLYSIGSTHSVGNSIPNPNSHMDETGASWAIKVIPTSDNNSPAPKFYIGLKGTSIERSKFFT